MGSDMTYHIFATQGQDIGGFFNASAAPGWCVYFGAPSAKAAGAAITGAGGQVMHGPAEVPGGAFTLQATDAQGARFALVGSA